MGVRLGLVIAALSSAGLASAGCAERALTEADCTMVKDRVAAAWNHDAVAAQRLADSDAFTQFIGDEGDRIASEVMDRCQGMVGRTVSEEELACLKAVDTIDDVYECAPR